MRRISIVTTLALLATSPTLLAQTQVEGQVMEILARADSGKLAAVWDLGLQISDLEGTEEVLSKAITKAAASAGGLGKLVAANALRHLADDSIFGKEILEVLKPVCGDKNDERRAAALSILGEEGLFSRRLKPDVRKILNDNMTADLVAPKVRIAASRSMWAVGSADERRTARSTLRDFLRSTNRDLQIEAALTLAEIGTDISGPEWTILRDVEHLPTPAGRLAKSYLKNQRTQRLYLRRLQNLANKNLKDLGSTPKPDSGADNGANSTGAKGKRDQTFEVLRELIYRAHAQHIRGEEVKQSVLIEAAAKGLVRSLDRHSTYFTSDEFARFFFDLDREYGGIGAFVNFDQDGDFSIVRPIYSGPAYGKGLKSGDKLIEVDGWETSGHSSDEIIHRLKGKPGTTVTVKITRPGFQKAEDVAIVRKKIQVPSVNAEMLPGDIGYLEVVTFAQNTADEVKKALVNLRKDGAKSLVLDVRNNTGGYLLAAVRLVELFVADKKLVVYTKGRLEEERQDYFTRDRAVAPDIPLAVLINRFSASASEITAGALQDHGRAQIVGKRSYGKGSVQNIMELQTRPPETFNDENKNGKHDEWESFDDLNGNKKFDVGPHIKLTTARYYLPSGRCLHKDINLDGSVVNPDWGITPDFKTELRDVKAKDAWKNSEVFELFKQNAFRSYVRKHMPKNEQLFLELAAGDGGVTTRYPDFDAYYKGLDTHLSEDDVRRWLRYIIRDEVADLRGKPYPGGRAVGDHQEDAQLQTAIKILLEKQGIDIRTVDAYKDVLRIAMDEPAAKKKAAKK